jgi:hypothetical protein
VVPAPAVGTASSVDQKDSGSSVVLLLVVALLGLIAANACFRLWRHRRQRQRQTVWRPTQESRWNAVLQQAETENRHRAASDSVNAEGQSSNGRDPARGALR